MPTHYQGSAEEIRALNAYIRLTRAVDAVASRILMEPHLEGLTPSQLGVLDALRYVGPMCQKELGSKILKSSGNITLVIDNLEKRGLVRRVRQAEDRRFITVSLTEDGQTLIDRIMPRHVADVTAAMNTLTPDEQETLGGLCKKLGKGLST